MIESVLAQAQHHVATYILLALPIIYFIYHLLTLPKQFDAPQLNASKQPAPGQLEKDINDAYPEYKDKFFWMQNSAVSRYLIVPRRYVNELKSAPADAVSFTASVEDLMVSEHTFIGSPGGPHDATLIKAVKIDLTRNIGTVIADLNVEAKYAFNEQLGKANDWTRWIPGQGLLRMVALVSGRTFVGPELSRNEDFLHSTITFTIDAFQSAFELRKYPKLLLKIPYMPELLVPQVKKARACLETMKRLMKPELESRAKLNDQPNDMITWFSGYIRPDKKYDTAWAAQYQLAASFAAIHTTTMTTTHAIFDLVSHPEYIDILRDEIETVLSEENAPSISKQSMPKLKKLDSFIRESQRLNPLGPTSFQRKMLKDYVLSDGTVLPKGTSIVVLSGPRSRDGELYERPDEFDGLRFFKMRQMPNQETKFQFVSTSPDHIHFGHGEHACPGRFFASNEIKIMLITLLQNYDIRLPTEAEGKRPENMHTSSGKAPNMIAEIEVRKRAVQ